MGRWYAPSSRGPSPKWWMASTMWAIGKDRGTQISSRIPFLIFSVFFFLGTSQIKRTVFLLLFCPSCPCPSLCTWLLCATFNVMKHMQDCTGNAWRGIFKRLRLTNLLTPPPPKSLHLSTRGCGNEHRNRDEIRIGCELGWRLVCRLKMGGVAEAEERSGDGLTMRRKVTNKGPVQENYRAAVE